mmetsp:Transcript_34684/g.79455  ORF Transcript_34684/g.79455 Transcript_34684/m.79455 type:complete len:497 (-) Transcript_34684:104-1594(-)
MGVIREVRDVVSPSTVGAQSFAVSDSQSRVLGSPAPCVAMAERVHPAMVTARRPAQASQSLQRAHTIAAPVTIPFGSEGVLMEPSLTPAAQLSMAIARAAGEQRGLDHIQAALRDAERACMRTQSIGFQSAGDIAEVTHITQQTRRMPTWHAPQAYMPIAIMQPPLPPAGIESRITALEARQRNAANNQSQTDFQLREEEYLLRIRELEATLEKDRLDADQANDDAEEEKNKAAGYYSELMSLRKEIVDVKVKADRDSQRAAELESEVRQWKAQSQSSAQDSAWEYNQVAQELSSVQAELLQKSELIIQMEQQLTMFGGLQEENDRFRRIVAELERAESDLRKSVQEYKKRGDLLEKEVTTIQAELSQQTALVESSRREMKTLQEDNAHLKKMVSERERAEKDLRLSMQEYKQRGDLLEKEIATLKEEKEFLQKRSTVQHETMNLAARIGEVTSSSWRQPSPRVQVREQVVMNLVDTYAESGGDHIQADLTADMDS